MPVKFTPGPHPTSQSRSSSSTSLPHHHLTPNHNSSSNNNDDDDGSQSPYQPTSSTSSPSHIPAVPHSTPTSIMVHKDTSTTTTPKSSIFITPGHRDVSTTPKNSRKPTTPGTSSPLTISFRPRQETLDDVERQPLLGRRHSQQQQDGQQEEEAEEEENRRKWIYPVLVGLGIFSILMLVGLGGWRLGMGEGGGRWPGGPH
ncbi:hypothetical protein BCR39DRAFT_514902 [Naematelia encephala]|uniref:Uncharacterized protein n=1 Tax=Naematelia encephala TaxID=71784 RepID=A0A1Y2BJ40_9TREE|nr:hypothetical protein BCR39DRAFT_514902 [Naematelia encephala]